MHSVKIISSRLIIALLFSAITLSVGIQPSSAISEIDGGEYIEGVSAKFTNLTSKNLEFGGRKGIVTSENTYDIEFMIPIQLEDQAKEMDDIFEWINVWTNFDPIEQWIPSDFCERTSVDRLDCAYPLKLSQFDGLRTDSAPWSFDFVSSSLTETATVWYVDDRDRAFERIEISIGESYIDEIFGEFIDIPKRIEIHEAGDFEVSVRTRTEPEVIDVAFYIDGRSVLTTMDRQNVEDNRFAGGRAAIFTYLWPLTHENNGSYELSAETLPSSNKLEPSDVLSSSIKSAQHNYTDIEVVVDIPAPEDIIPDCQEKSEAVTTLMQALVDKRSTELQQIETIDTKIRDFYVNSDLDAEGYADATEAVDTANQAVYTAMTELVASSSLDCSQDLAPQISMFIGDQQSVLDALRDYVSAVVALADTIQGNE